MPVDAPAAVLGIATIFCRPLRYLFDVESSIAVLRNGSSDDKSSGEGDDVLGYVHAHVSIATSRDQSSSNGRAQDSDAIEDFNQPIEELAGLIGRFVWVRVRLQLVPEERVASIVTSSRMRVHYQLSSATESFLLPVDHTNIFKVLVTQELLAQVSTKALQFNFLIPQERVDPTPEAKGEPSEKPTVAMAVGISLEDAEAARKATATATMAAESAAKAAREAVAAAKSTMDAAMAAQAKEAERLRDESKIRAIEIGKINALETHAMERERAMAKQQCDHELQLMAGEKQRLADATSRLERELEEKQRTMDKWTQQTATTDPAIELLKQRLAGDAKELDELQRRLRVLEEEKQELLKKSRACVVQ